MSLAERVYTFIQSDIALYCVALLMYNERHKDSKVPSALFPMKSTEIQTLGNLRIRDSLPLLGWVISLSLLAVSHW